MRVETALLTTQTDLTMKDLSFALTYGRGNSEEMEGILGTSHSLKDLSHI